MKKISTQITVFALMMFATFCLGIPAVNAQTGTPTVSTDKLDYPPGATAIISGKGFKPNETVTLQVIHVGETGDNAVSGAHAPWTVSADAFGNISAQWTVPFDEDELGATLKLTAVGQNSSLHAEWTFTDARSDYTSQISSSSACVSTLKNFAITLANVSNTGQPRTFQSAEIIIPTGLTLTDFSNISISATTGNSWSRVLPGASGKIQFKANAATDDIATAQSIVISFDLTAPSSGNYPFTSNVYQANNFQSGSQIGDLFTLVTMPNNVTSTVYPSVTVSQLPTVNVGGAVTAITQGGTTAALGGSFGGSATAAVWSDGLTGATAGTFTNNTGSTPNNTTYTASASAPSSVTLTLTTSGGSCGTTSASKTLTVNPSCTAPTITAQPNNTNANITYGSNATFTVTTSSAVSSYQWQQGVTLNGTTTWSNIDGTANTSAITATLTLTKPTVSMSGNKYRVILSNCTPAQTTTSDGSALLTVSAKAITIKANSQSKTYGDVLALGTSAFVVDPTTPMVSGESISSVTLTSAGAAASATVAGSPYSIVPSAAVAGTGTNLNNYAITYANGTLTVDPRTLTVTANSSSKTYGATVTFAGTEFTTGTGQLVNGDAVTSAALASAGAAGTAAKGSYDINVSTAAGTGLSNYTIGYAKGTLTVDPRTLTVTANSSSKTYGATVTFAGTEFTTGTGQLVNGDAVTSAALASTGAAGTAAKGSYDINVSTAAGTGLSNYTIGYAKGTLTVDPRTLTVTANSSSKTYGATVTFAGTEFTTGTGQLVNGDAVTSAALASAGAAGTAAKGSYDINVSTAAGTGLSNYTIGYAKGTLTVDPRTLTVTANSSSKTYGATVTFAGTEFTTGTGQLVNGDAVTSAALASAGAAGTAAKGSYDINVSTAAGTGLSNYTIGYAKGTLTVDPRTLTVTANSSSKTYGATVTFAGTEFTTGTGELVNGDAVTSAALASTGAAGTAAKGSYDINVSTAAGTGLSNYTIGYAKGTLTVDPRTLTVTANSSSKTYGATVTFAGTEFTTGTGELVNGDAVTSAALASTGAAGTAAKGSYDINVSTAAGTGLSNYTIGYAKGTLTVDPRTLTVTANSSSKTYGATVTFAGTEFTTGTGQLVNGDAVTSAALASTGAAGTAAKGSYDINVSTAAGTGLSNYTIGYAKGTLTVDPRTLTVTANSSSKTYGATVTFAGTEFTTGTGELVNGDAVTSAALASTGAAGTAAKGSYDINVSTAAGTGLSNYTIGYAKGTLTVDPRTLTVTANSSSKTYGATVTFAGTEFTTGTGQLVNGDAVTSAALASTGAAGTAAKGSYDINVSTAAGTGLSNYTIGYAKGTLTVDPRTLTVTANSSSKTYGATVTFAGTEFTTGTGQLVNGDAVTSAALASTGAAGTAAKGSYDINVSTAAGTGLSNYTIGYAKGTLTVDPRTLTVTANSSSKTYGATVTFAGTEFTTGTGQLVNGDAVTSAALASAGAAGTAAKGSYDINVSTAAGTGLSNYTIGYAKGTLTVDPRTLTVTANSSSKTYGATVTFAGTEFTTGTGQLVNGDAVTSAALASAGAAGTAAKGSYDINVSTAAGTGLSNYTIGYAKGTLTVDPRTLTVTANSSSKTYGATVTFAGTEFTTGTGELVNGDAVTSAALASTGAAGTAAKGSYDINVSTAAGTGLSNYTIGYAKGTLTVDPRTLTVTANSSSKTYGATVTFAGTEFTTGTGQLVNGDAVTSAALASTGAAGTAAKGSYDINVSTAAGTGLSNYTIGYAKGTLTVDPRTLTVTANSSSKTYGATVTFAGTEFTTGTGELVNGDAVTSAALASTGAAGTAAKGSYDINVSTAAGTGLSNYTIGYAKGTLTVDPRTLTVTANSSSKTYGATVTFAGTEFTTGTGQLVNGDAVTSAALASTGAAGTAAKGSYDINVSTAAGTGLSNYTIGYAKGTLTVDPRTLTVTANSSSKTYGATVTFAGTEFTTGTGQLVNGDAVTSAALASTGAAGTAAKGSYDINVSTAAGTGLSNYTIGYAKGTLTVDPRTLTVTANSSSKTYGSTVTFAGTEFTTGTGQLVNGDAVTSAALASTGAAGTAAKGSYDINVSTAAGTGLSNYTIGYAKGTLTVDPRTLTVTANSSSKTYGATVTFAGTEFTTGTGQLVNGDAVTSAALASTGAAGTAAKGSYDINVSTAAGTGLSNYTIGYAKGTLTVDPRTLTVTANSSSKTYGATVTFAGTEFTTGTGQLVNGDAVTSAALASTGAAGTAAKGSYDINVSTAAGTGLSNYTIGYAKGTLTVDPRTLTVTANSSSKTYGATVTFAGTEFTTGTGQLVNGDAVTSAALASTGAAGTAAKGSYDINVSTAAGTGLSNYTIGYAKGTLTVDPRTLTVTANSSSKTYGATVTFAGTEFTTGTGQLVNGDAVTSAALASTGAAGTAAKGSYDINVSTAAGTGLSNYTIGYAKGTLTVDPRTLTVTANSSSKTYGATVTFAGTEFTTGTGELVNGDAVTSAALASTGAAGTAAKGSYDINVSTAAGTGLSNYTIGYAKGTLTVDPRTLTVTANSSSKTYGATVTFAGTEFTTGTGELVNGDAVTSAALASTGAAGTAAKGSYDINVSTAAGTGLSNYTIGYAKGTLTVDPRTLTVTANSSSKTYGATVTFAGTEFTTGTGQLVNGDAVTSAALASTGAAGTAAKGSYDINVSTAAGTGLSNYTIGYAKGTLTVDPRTLTVTANSSSKTYGATVTFAGTEFTTGTGQLVNGDAVTSAALASTGAAGTAAKGSYDINVSTAAGTGLSNYTIGYAKGTLTVDPRTLTVTANSSSKTYGATVTFAGTEFTTGTGQLVNGDAVTSAALASTGAAGTAAKGSYDINVSTAAGTGLSNYTIGYAKGTLTVDPRTLTVTANSSSKTYGATVTFAGTEFTTGTGELVNGDAVTSAALASTGAAGTAAKGSYDINVSTAAGTGLSNYTIGYAKGTLTVDPRTLTVTANSSSKTYGATVTFAGTEFTTGTGQLVNGDAVTSAALASTGAAGTAAKGSYDINVSTAAGTGLSNYTIGYAKGTLTVDPRTLTVTANSSSKTYGATVTFAGTEFTTGTGQLVNGDAVTSAALASTGAAGTAAKGSYDINVSTAAGTGLSNYTIGYAKGTLTVDPRTLTVTANSSSKTYGATVTFAGTEFTTGTGQLVNGDAVTSAALASTGAAGTAAKGSYDINVSTAAGTGLSNYTIGYAKGTLTVNPKDLLITANDRTKTYGQTVTFAGTEFTPHAGDLVNTDGVTSVTLVSTGAAPTATVMTPGPTYSITPSAATGTGLSNYNITYANGKLTVTLAALTVKANSYTILCGQDLPVYAGTITGILNSDQISGTYALATPANGVGSYDIMPTLSGAALSNYSVVASTKGTLTINAVTVDGNANVNPQPTKTTATSVTFKVTTLTGAIAPNVSVSLYVDDKTTALNTNTDASGIATFNLGTLAADVYRLKAVVGSNCNETTVYLPVYDPTGGFVTGGGWINSPIYTDLPYMKVDGKANFGFVSKYEPGKTIPTGNTEFQFKASGMNFSSTSYDWLVVSGKKAQYKGTGTINGTGSYSFILTAIDGDLSNPISSDLFRIKIVDNGTKRTVYDNQYGTGTTADDADPTTAIGGGSIVIHTKTNGSNATTAPSIVTASAVAPTQQLFTERFSATAYPNPTVSFFTIKLSSGNTKDAIAIRVIDEMGRLVEMKNNLAEGQTIQIGQAYRSGIYFVDVMQGNTRRQLKLIKNK